MKRGLVIILGCALAATAIAQPDPGSGGVPDDPGSAGSAGTGSGSAGSAGTGSAGTGSGSAGTGSAGTGSAGTGSAGSGSAGTGSAGTGSGSAGSGSGSAKGPIIIQIPTDADAPQVSAAAAPTEIKLGGKFTLFVTATFQAGVVVNLPEPIDLGPAFEVTRKDSQDTGLPDGRTTREWQIEVIAWELGDLMVPPVRVTYTSQGKGMQTATNASKVRVLGVLGDVVDDPKAMRTNADPHDLLVRDWFWAWVAGGGLVLLILLVSLVLHLRARRRRRAMVGGFVSSGSRKFDTPASRALEKLLAIEASGVLDRDDDRKQGYAEMVDVIRVYLGTRYRVATFDLTTYELMRLLKKAAPAGDARAADELKMIERWLESCDIVKYGGLKATAADGKATLEGARELVLTTSQTPVAPEKPVEPREATVEVSSSLASQVVTDDASPAATKTGWQADTSQATRAAQLAAETSQATAERGASHVETSPADRSQAVTTRAASHAETSQATRAAESSQAATTRAETSQATRAADRSQAATTRAETSQATRAADRAQAVSTTSQADRSQAVTTRAAETARAIDDDAPTTEVAKVDPDDAGDTRDEIPTAAQEPLLSPEERARLERARWGRPS